MDENLILYFFWLLLEIELLSQMVPFHIAGHILCHVPCLTLRIYPPIISGECAL